MAQKAVFDGTSACSFCQLCAAQLRTPLLLLAESSESSLHYYTIAPVSRLFYTHVNNFTGTTLPFIASDMSVPRHP